MFGDATCEMIYCFYFYTLNNANSSQYGCCTLVTVVKWIIVFICKENNK